MSKENKKGDPKCPNCGGEGFFDDDGVKKACPCQATV